LGLSQCQWLYIFFTYFEGEITGSHSSDTRPITISLLSAARYHVWSASTGDGSCTDSPKASAEINYLFKREDEEGCESHFA